MKRAMKQSGIPWIGEVPEGWRIGRIKFAINTFGSGTTPESGNEFYYADEGHFWVQSGDLYNTKYIYDTQKKITDLALANCKSLQKYKSDFIVIAMYGASIGNTSISKIDAYVNQACYCLKTDSNNYLKYLYYYFDVCRENILEKSFGGTQPNINSGIIRNQIMIFPPLPEQTAIANFLDNKCQKIDALIETEEKIIAELKEYKKSVIQKAIAKGILKTETARFKNFVESSNTGLSITKEFWDENGDVLLYTAGQKPVLTNYKNFPQELLTTDKDILVARNGAGAIQIPEINSTYTDHVIRFIIKPSINKRFVYYILCNCVERIAAEANDVSLKTLSKSTWYDQSFFVPPLPEQTAIASYLDKKTSEVDNLIAIKQQKITQLKEYKKSLIYEYVTGKKEVPLC
jgi:type I restriction enzyme S subunit